jgi:hypothetical protein
MGGVTLTAMKEMDYRELKWCSDLSKRMSEAKTDAWNGVAGGDRKKS